MFGNPPVKVTRGYTMPDGSKVETHVFSASDSILYQILNLWTQNMQHDESSITNMAVVGFDVVWSMVQEGDNDDEVNPRVTLLKRGSKYGCLLVKRDVKSRSVHYSLRHFLLTKNITFAGTHIKEDLIKLKSDHGIVIRNVVDLADLKDLVASKLIGFHPPRPACNLRCLANCLLSFPMGRSWSHWNTFWVWVKNWGQDGLTEEQIEAATTEVYLICRIAYRLLAVVTFTYRCYVLV